MADAIMESNQPEEENQPETEKAENLDNRLPYETPKLRKHGKVNDATKLIPRPGFFDGPFGPRFDIS
ncbi:DEAD/DEAH box helicase [Rivularia sp. UHCC 0363]|uniref:DEAD/DEAH box helicase n=1 Tax=Rivularia sp. UHCC 0363 TaxID=3110244 RepID=UPI002B219420|nr:DEAD/DEAH box helicase [Rivularia sp. UHCC 0363]MEA5593419.1 DEAD/DEAH box helicase [Rivularia sp. UHCC 0363]